jgi:hypothetical protein
MSDLRAYPVPGRTSALVIACLCVLALVPLAAPAGAAGEVGGTSVLSGDAGGAQPATQYDDPPPSVSVFFYGLNQQGVVGPFSRYFYRIQGPSELPVDGFSWGFTDFPGREVYSGVGAPPFWEEDDGETDGKFWIRFTYLSGEGTWNGGSFDNFKVDSVLPPISQVTWNMSSGQSGPVTGPGAVPTPEPCTMALLGSTALAIGLPRLRRRKRAPKAG